MAEHALTIPYSDDLLLSLKESPEEFEAEARLLLAVKLYELGRLSTGRAAALAGRSAWSSSSPSAAYHHLLPL